MDNDTLVWSVDDADEDMAQLSLIWDLLGDEFRVQRGYRIEDIPRIHHVS